MKKVLLTESQIRLINEEIDRNDSIQKLLFTEPSEIKFEKEDSVSSTGSPVSRLIPVIDGKKIGENQVKLSADEIKVKNTVMYQLHIDVNYNIRRLGVAEKLYTAFILQGNPVCSLSNNRESSEAIENLWKKLSQNPEISVKPMKYNGKEVGIIALRK